jgi:hypothetical protein
MSDGKDPDEPRPATPAAPARQPRHGRAPSDGTAHDRGRAIVEAAGLLEWRNRHAGLLVGIGGIIVGVARPGPLGAANIALGVLASPSGGTAAGATAHPA